jgi:cytochrome c oxidase cbb3-type subunit 3
MAEHDDKLLDHDYDGIKELDNDLPRWWLWLFYATIIFGVLYMVYFDVLQLGYSSADAWQSEVNPAYVRERDKQASYFGIIPRYRAPLAVVTAAEADLAVRPAVVFLTRETDTTTYTPLMDSDALATGHELFLSKCASCHGNLGEGGVGPNLTDDYWLHGAEFSDIVKSVRYGYPTKGMVAWLGQLTPDDIITVASHVTTLVGTNPPNAKAPEGERVGG